jgi:hypothetical protein
MGNQLFMEPGGVRRRKRAHGQMPDLEATMRKKQEFIFNSNSANFAQNDGIVGQYATCMLSSTKRGKASWTTTYHYPWAKAPLKFLIKFWRY